MKTIIEMAREAGGGLSCIAEPLEHPWKFSQNELERFAALAAAAEQKKWEDQTAIEIHEAILDEREACAMIGDSMDPLQDGAIGRAIRARGQA
jgi:hypothetical protein